MKVEIPKNIEELIDLGTSINTKHELDGVASPLNSMKDYSWQVEGPKLPLGLAKHLEAEELKRQSEIAFKERDLLLTNTVAIIRASRDILLGVNHQKPERW